MNANNYDHLVVINEKERLVSLYRVSGKEQHLYTSIKLPENNLKENSEEFKAVCLKLGEDIIIDSPVARKLLGI